MNKKQKIIMWIGITIFVLMGLFPPYEYESETSYGLLIDPDGYSELDFIRLAIQWIIVSVLTVGAIYSTKGTKNISSEKDT